MLAGGFGLFIAANYSLTSIILVELITLERFTNAYGLLLLVQGVANLVGPPLAGTYRIVGWVFHANIKKKKNKLMFSSRLLSGWISDLTDSYDLAFYLAGFFIVISGALLLVLPTILKVRKIVDKRRRSSALANGDSVKLNKKVIWTGRTKPREESVSMQAIFYAPIQSTGIVGKLSAAKQQCRHETRRTRSENHVREQWQAHRDGSRRQEWFHPERDGHGRRARVWAQRLQAADRRGGHGLGRWWMDGNTVPGCTPVVIGFFHNIVNV